MLEYTRDVQDRTTDAQPLTVKVIGLGGAGANVLDRIALEGMEGAELVSMNTDIRALNTSVANNKIQLGKTLTQGLAAGGDPELGLQAAQEAEAEIRAELQTAAMVFICGGLGGGTGSGAAPYIARLAREEGAFVVGFVTMPFSFEGKRRQEQAYEALTGLETDANALVTFDNDRMGDLVLPKEGIQQAFEAADQIISQSVRAVTKLVTQPGLIRIGMDDLLTALRNANSRCLFGFGQAKGENRAQEALSRALKSPLLDKGKLLENASNAIVQVTGGETMTLYEVELLMNEVSKHVEDSAQILFGVSADGKLGDQISVTIISSVQEAHMKPATVAAAEASEEPAAAADPASGAAVAPAAAAPAAAAAAPSPEPAVSPPPESVAEAVAPKKPEAPVQEDPEFEPVTAEPVPAVEPVPEPQPPSELEPEPELILADETPVVEVPIPAPEPVEEAPVPVVSEPEPVPAAAIEEEPPVFVDPSLPTLEETMPIPPVDEVVPEAVSEPAPSEESLDDVLEELVEDDVEPVAEPEPVPASAPETKPEPKPKPKAKAKPRRTRKKAKPAARSPEEVSSEPAQEELIPKKSAARGRFEKSEPTIIDGEDLDVPTFLRKKGD